MKVIDIQKSCCLHYDAEFAAVQHDQLVVISDGVLDSNIPVEGVRYPSPKHMSGWWLTTDRYDGNVNSLKTIHYSHIVEQRPDIAVYMALPFGYRFLLGENEKCVWFDDVVAKEPTC